MCDEKKINFLHLCGRFNKLRGRFNNPLYIYACNRASIPCGTKKMSTVWKMWTQVDLLTQELRNLQATTQKEQESMRMEVQRLTDKLQQSTVTADLEKKEMAEEV